MGEKEQRRSCLPRGHRLRACAAGSALGRHHQHRIHPRPPPTPSPPPEGSQRCRSIGALPPSCLQIPQPSPPFSPSHHCRCRVPSVSPPLPSPPSTNCKAVRSGSHGLTTTDLAITVAGSG
uniref:Uncharacterized protein n=1 Tax=Oryza barthii TaxID=65489 RepID=A0A0D3GMQ4_9ORYZ